MKQILALPTQGYFFNGGKYNFLIVYAYLFIIS